jgi:hypothetical protein
MKQTKYYLHKLKKFLETESEEGRKLIKVKQQQKKEKTHFKIHPVYENNSICSVNVEKSTLQMETILPISAFEVVIEALIKSDEQILPKGKPQIKGVKIGDKDLEITTLESIVAMNIYGKNKGDSGVYRRIPVISNILVQAGICENVRNGSKLKLV